MGLRSEIHRLTGLHIPKSKIGKKAALARQGLGAVGDMHRTAQKQKARRDAIRKEIQEKRAQRMVGNNEVSSPREPAASGGRAQKRSTRRRERSNRLEDAIKPQLRNKRLQNLADKAKPTFRNQRLQDAAEKYGKIPGLGGGSPKNTSMGFGEESYGQAALPRGISNTPEMKQLQKSYEGDLEKLDKLLKNIPKKPDFPFLLFSSALWMDILGAIAEGLTLGTIGTILMWVLNVFFTILVWFATWGKHDVLGRNTTKALAKILFGAVLVGESIPLVNILPFWTIYVVLTHYHETKVAQKISNVGNAIADLEARRFISAAFSVRKELRQLAQLPQAAADVVTRPFERPIIAAQETFKQGMRAAVRAPFALKKSIRKSRKSSKRARSDIRAAKKTGRRAVRDTVWKGAKLGARGAWAGGVKAPVAVGRGIRRGAFGAAKGAYVAGFKTPRTARKAIRSAKRSAGRAVRRGAWSGTRGAAKLGAKAAWAGGVKAPVAVGRGIRRGAFGAAKGAYVAGFKTPRTARKAIRSAKRSAGRAVRRGAWSGTRGAAKLGAKAAWAGGVKAPVAVGRGIRRGAFGAAKGAYVAGFKTPRTARKAIRSAKRSAGRAVRRGAWSGTRGAAKLGAKAAWAGGVKAPVAVGRGIRRGAFGAAKGAYRLANTPRYLGEAAAKGSYAVHVKAPRAIGKRIGKGAYAAERVLRSAKRSAGRAVRRGAWSGTRGAAKLGAKAAWAGGVKAPVAVGRGARKVAGNEIKAAYRLANVPREIGNAAVRGERRLRREIDERAVVREFKKKAA